jgi:hypothetical protein
MEWRRHHYLGGLEFWVLGLFSCLIPRLNNDELREKIERERGVAGWIVL